MISPRSTHRLRDGMLRGATAAAVVALLLTSTSAWAAQRSSVEGEGAGSPDVARAIGVADASAGEIASAEEAESARAPEAQPGRAAATGPVAGAVDEAAVAGGSAEASRAGSSSPIDLAIAMAQKRSVKVFGAQIADRDGYAAGIIVSGDGKILTADGVHLTGQNLQVVLHDGRVYSAELVRRSERWHAAILKIDAKTPLHFKLPDEPVGQPLDWVLAVGNWYKLAEGDEPLSVNAGIISARAELETKRRVMGVDFDGEVLLLDAITSNPGAPGGAVVTLDGQLAGMLGRTLESASTSTRLNYAVPADLLGPFVRNEGDDAVVAESDSGDESPRFHGDLGVRLMTLSGPRAAAYIDRVIADSPAEAVGLAPDDLILRINGIGVWDVREAQRAFRTLPASSDVVIEVKRGFRILQVRIDADKARSAGKE